MHKAQHTVYLHTLASAKCNTSVCNDKYLRQETYTDSTLASEASLKLPWSVTQQSWQSNLAIESQVTQPLCLLVRALVQKLSDDFLRYEGACSKLRAYIAQAFLTVKVASAKTAAVGYPRQVDKLYRHNQSTAFESQMSFCVRVWRNVILCPSLRV